MINFQQRKTEPLEIYQMAASAQPWDIFPMAISVEKKAEAERRAQEMYQRLMVLRKLHAPDLSNNQWCKSATVSTSFFTNMQGTKKPASEPSVGNLRSVLGVIGVSLPEFFLAEAEGRLIEAPTPQALERALIDALEGDLPRKTDARAAYLASTVRKLLGLPEDRQTNRDNMDSTSRDARGADAPARSATKRA